MNYKRLIAGVNAYKRKTKMNRESFPKRPYLDGGGEPDYYDALNDKNPEYKRIKIIVNKWGRCRIKINYAKLKKALMIFKEKQKTILPWDITQTALWNIHDNILELFNCFAEALKYTGASKALHILHPAFFVMWDETIRYEYGCSKNGEGYFNFLVRSQKEIKEVLETYIMEHGNAHDPSKEIPQKIYGKIYGKSKPILKL